VINDLHRERRQGEREEDDSVVLLLYEGLHPKISAGMHIAYLIDYYSLHSSVVVGSGGKSS